VPTTSSVSEIAVASLSSSDNILDLFIVLPKLFRVPHLRVVHEAASLLPLLVRGGVASRDGGWDVGTVAQLQCPGKLLLTGVGDSLEMLSELKEGGRSDLSFPA
jgi:hypothetical protein